MKIVKGILIASALICLCSSPYRFGVAVCNDTAGGILDILIGIGLIYVLIKIWR